MIFDRLADGIIRHSKAIIAIWVVILICSVPLALKSQDVMKYDTNDMAGDDSESIQGLVKIGEYFPSSQSDATAMPILVMYFKDDSGMTNSEKFVNYLNGRLGEYTDENGVRKITSVISLGPQYGDHTDGKGIVMAGVVYASDDINVSADTPVLRDFISGCINDFKETVGGSTGFEEYLTGSPAIGYDAQAGSAADIQRIDPFTILLVLVLVGLFFRSFVTSATPPLTIGVAFAVVLALIFGIGQIMNIFFITEMMLLVSMMGAGCDYCIFIIARYREELRSGKDHDAALREAIKWAGESISISGASVIIGFGTMSICSFSMVSTMGICLALGILVALLAALTLIPSILALVGDRIFWPSKMDSFKEGGKSTKGWYAKCGKLGHAYFEHSAKFSIKHAKAILAVTILVSAPAAYIALTSETSYDMVSSMQNGDSGKGMELIGDYADQGMIMPNYAIMEFDQPIANVTVQSYDETTKNYTGTLVWTDYWTASTLTNPVTGVKESLSDRAEALYANAIEKDGGADGNLSYVYGPFMWDRAVAAAMKAGITDPEQIIGFAVQNAHGATQKYVAMAVESMTEHMKGIISAQMPPGTPDEVITAQAMNAVIGSGAPNIDFVANCLGALVGGAYAEGGVTVDPATPKDVTYISIIAATHDAAMSPRSMESIDAISAALNDFKAENPGVVTGSWITGTAAVMYEVSKTIGDEFNKIEVVVILLIILLLFVVMRSYTIPLRSVATILMSICWTLAATHLLFTNVLGAEIMWLIPLILLVICLGLGMDYDILLTTRIRENVMDKGMTNDEAIHQAVIHSGSVITICGLIMGGAFGTLMLSGMTLMQEFGFALCFAILVDALIVRTYIVPAVMHLLGDWNWKGPGAAALMNRSKDSE